MIEIKGMPASRPSDGQPLNRDIEGFLGIYLDGRLIGALDARPGGSASIWQTVSEVVEDEIRTAIDSHDPGCNDRTVLLAPHDPRRRYGNTG